MQSKFWKKHELSGKCRVDAHFNKQQGYQSKGYERKIKLYMRWIWRPCAVMDD